MHSASTTDRAWIRWLAPAIGVVTMAGLLAVGGRRPDDAAPVTIGESSPLDRAVVANADSGGDASVDATITPSATDAPAAAGTGSGAPTAANPQRQIGTGPTSETAPSGADARATGVGITAETITIGIGWFDINAYANLFAPTAEESGGTTRDAAEAVIRWLNDNGGIAGRQIEPIYHEYPLQDVGTNSARSTREQAMCADFTEDHQAFAAIPWIAAQGVFYECAAQHNLVAIATSFSEGMVDETMFERLGHVFYMPHSFLIDRRERMIVQQLERRGFFTPDAKVGVIIEDTAQQRRGGERALLPALQGRGVDVVATAYYTPELSTDWSNMVLRFRSSGVTHVVWGASACTFICSGQFMTASESQGYRPFNALGSDHGLTGQTLVTPEGQRERIVAVSWSPTDEGYTAYDAAKPINDADARCREVKAQSGRDLDQHLFAPYCDGLFFLKRALEASPSLTAEGLRATVEAPGFAHDVIDTWSSTWGPGRHDAANAVRDIAYVPDCECFRFSGPTHPVE